MKKNIIKRYGALFLLIFFMSACDKWIDPDINKDPNAPLDVPLNLLLPTTEAGLAYTTGGDLLRPTSIWMQQMAGISNQSEDQDKYIFIESDVENAWKWQMYAGVMMDMNTIIKKAGDANPYYRGIARVLLAYSMSVVTDLWGDVPFSQAWQGDANLKPGYDKQEVIYASLQTMLDGAIIDLGKAEADNTYLPGDDDYMYGGDVDKWKQAAGVLKARFYLHLSSRDVNAYTKALAVLTANSFTGNADDLELIFGSGLNEANPAFQFENDRPDYVAMGKYFVDKLVTDSDPRLPVFVNTTDTTLGSPAGNADPEASKIGDYFVTINSPVSLISYVEQLFIKAECLFPTDKAGAATAYNDAVKASLAKFSVTNSAWEAIHANETAGTITLAKIMNAKYTALFMNIEVYNDWRRTGFPALTPAVNATTPGGVIPRRFPYALPERLYNGTNYDAAVSAQGWTKGGGSLIERVWWDKP